MADQEVEKQYRLTIGWKGAIIVALLFAIGNSGVDALRNREEQRFQNHEKRIDELENRIRSLQAAVDASRK
jgi:hypothetical protein